MNYKDKLELEFTLTLRSCTTETEKGICQAILEKELLEKGYIVTESGKLHEIMEEDNGRLV
tara:strand:- start:5378 stop:5560 length:183 start_codon:yes stop_codon:yes gene_type:complete